MAGLEQEQEKENEQIEGCLMRIRFKNDSGFLIGEFQDEKNNRFNAVGTLMNPQVKMDYILSGYYVEDPKYGEQLRFDHYESIIPLDETGIFKYIVRVCKFVGVVVGNALVDKYGDQTLILLKTNPEKIAQEINGITLDRAREIQETLIDNEVNESVTIELGKILDTPGMRKTLQADLIRDYKSKAADIVKADPYILTTYNGIGFPLADRVALNIGFARDSIKRKKAVVLHCMKENMSGDGSIWIHHHHLMQKIAVLIQVPDPDDGVWELIDDEVIVRLLGEVDINDSSFAVTNASRDELYIANKVVKMVMGGAS